MEILIEGAQRLGLLLSSEQQRQFQIYYQELLAWNSRINLTSVVDWEEVQKRHFLDSLTIGLVLPHKTLAGGWVLDVGSGAGLPGLPLKIAFPGMKLALLDSTAKKTAFLEHIVRALGLEEVQVYTGRAEDMCHDPAFRESFDAVVSRAVSPLRVLAELTLPFCRLGGVVVAPKNGPVREEMAEAEVAIKTLGACLREVRELELEGMADERVLVVLEKVTPTPSQYSRRPGIPKKRPL